MAADAGTDAQPAKRRGRPPKAAIAASPAAASKETAASAGGGGGAARGKKRGAETNSNPAESIKVSKQQNDDGANRPMDLQR